MPTLRIAQDRLPPEGGRTYWLLGGRSVAVFNVAGEFYVIEDSCPHQGASLCTGKLDGLSIQCRAHGLRFDLRTGRLASGGALAVTRYPLRREGDEWWLDLPDGDG